jgi:hypothetical protein
MKLRIRCSSGSSPEYSLPKIREISRILVYGSFTLVSSTDINIALLIN